MEQTTCCQTDVESIMRRLKGGNTPYTQPKPQLSPLPSTSSEVSELKTIVKTLGAKLKDAYQELADNNAALSSSEQIQHSLKQAIEQLKASLSSKTQEFETAENELQQRSLTIEQLERDLVNVRSKASTPLPSPDLANLRDELLAIRAEQLNWHEERKRLETLLEQEHHKGRSETSNTNGQLVRLAMGCKQLEEEIHSLKCERAATLRQFNQYKDLSEESQKALAAEREKGHEREEALASSTRTIQELLDTIEKNKTAINALNEAQEEAAHKEDSLLAEISLERASLAKEKAACEALSISLNAANESFHALSSQLEQERRLFHETDEKCMLFQKEKEAADTRVKEVEELLIIKLQTISDLEEQLGEAITQCDDTEHRAVNSEEGAARLAEDLHKMTEARDSLHDKGLKLEQQLGRTSAENAELKKRSEAFERMKKVIVEASSHAHAILRTLDGSTKPTPAISQLVEELSIHPQEQERSLFEERFEQHELF